MLDKCDHAGFFKPNLKLANFCIDFEFKTEDIIGQFGDRIEVVGDKWFLTKYIKFQYIYLTDENNMYKPVTNLLKQKGVTSPFVAPSEGVARVNYKGKGKGNKKGKGIKIEKENSWYKDLYKDYPNIDIDSELSRFYKWEKDSPRNNHKKAFRNWLNNAEKWQKEDKHGRHTKHIRQNTTEDKYAGIGKKVE